MSALWQPASGPHGRQPVGRMTAGEQRPSHPAWPRATACPGLSVARREAELWQPAGGERHATHASAPPASRHAGSRECAPRTYRRPKPPTARGPTATAPQPAHGYRPDGRGAPTPPTALATTRRGATRAHGRSTARGPRPDLGRRHGTAPPGGRGRPTATAPGTTRPAARHTPRPNDTARRPAPRRTALARRHGTASTPGARLRPTANGATAATPEAAHGAHGAGAQPRRARHGTPDSGARADSPALGTMGRRHGTAVTRRAPDAPGARPRGTAPTPGASAARGASAAPRRPAGRRRRALPRLSVSGRRPGGSARSPTA